MPTVRARIASAVTFATHHRLREAVTAVLALVAFCLGVMAVVAPHEFTSETFALATALVAPQVWGVLLVGLVVVLAFTITVNAEHAMWPTLGLTLTFLALAFATTLSVPDDGEPFVPLLLYGMGLLFALMAAAYTVPARER